LNLALVSSDKTVRETTKRPHTLEAYVKVVRKAYALGFKIVSYQILGLPNESLDSMIQTLAFNARLPVLLGASPFYLTPHAPIAAGVDFTEDDYLRARLTAMAIETSEFSREDIYTLFIATRIINFLKWLPISSSADLLELVMRPWSDYRTAIGFELLRRLAENRHFYFWNKKGLIENKKFKTDLFLRVLSEAGVISCQNGKQIAVGEFARSMARRPSVAFFVPLATSAVDAR
jgi:hypothetical protein